ncbi:MAG TPA: hypothetical protein VNI55_03660 [Gaiellaceae bacterium]|nr:hypothetical protein [Gaiellaceae bacterium]
MLRLFLLVLLAFAFPATADTAPMASSFRVGTGVVCKLASSNLVVCSGTRSGSMAIRAAGTPVSTGMRILPSASTPRLRAGKTWRRGAISCTAGSAEVTCRNRSGDVLILSPSRVVVLAADAAVSP